MMTRMLVHRLDAGSDLFAGDGYAEQYHQDGRGAQRRFRSGLVSEEDSAKLPQTNLRRPKVRDRESILPQKVGDTTCTTHHRGLWKGPNSGHANEVEHCKRLLNAGITYKHGDV